MPRADKAAAWKHDLSPIVLDRLRRIIPSLDGHYHRLDKAPAAERGQKLARYAAFQRLRRQLGESETDHRARQAQWLCRRRAFERENRELSDDIKSAWPHDSDNGAEIPLGTWIASSEQVTGSDLADFISVSATGRALVFDIASDKELLMERISELIDKEREAAGIAPAVRRGPTSSAKTKTAAIHSEQREFLRAIRDHCIVRLWDMQLAGTAIEKSATARLLYPIIHEKRSLLAKIRRAEELQQEALSWIPRLRAVMGTR